MTTRHATDASAPAPSLDDDAATTDTTSTLNLRALGEGSHAALSRLYASHSRHVFAIAYRLTRSTDDADDVMQEVFVRLPELVARYDARGTFERWLTSVTVRAALTLMRRTRARAEDSLDTTHPLAGPATTEPLERIALDDALRRLPPDARTLLLLRAEGYTHAEIGELMEIRSGTSEVRLFRARQALRALLGESDER